MTNLVASGYRESWPFARARVAGDLTFVSAGPGGAPDGRRRSIDRQTVAAVANLAAALSEVGRTVADLACLVVFVLNYSERDRVAQALRRVLPGGLVPAVSFIGVTGLPEGDGLQLDAVASASIGRRVVASGVRGRLPTEHGWPHAVEAGDLYFLSGVSAIPPPEGQPFNVGEQITVQARISVGLVEEVLDAGGYELGEIFRTHLFVPDLALRQQYPDGRRDRYQATFRLGGFPANSVIGIQSVGMNVQLRMLAIASHGAKRYVSSEAVRELPSAYSQAVLVGDWLFVAGQDASTLDNQVAEPRNVEGQARVALNHVRDLVEAGGGSIADIAKLTIYLVPGASEQSVWSVLDEFFAGAQSRPSGLVVGVRELATNALVEIDAVAYLPPSQAPLHRSP